MRCRGISIGAWYEKDEGLYQVFGLAENSKTGDWFVCYVHEGGEYFVAVPLEEFKRDFNLVEEPEC